MEPILKRRVGSVLQALEDATCDTFNLQELENEIADIMAPTAGGLPKKSDITTRENEPVIVGENFSFVRPKQEYIPGLSIPQEGESKPTDKKLNFLTTGQSQTKQYQKPNYASTDARYRDFGFSRGNYNHHRHQQNRSPRGQDKDIPFRSYDQRGIGDRFSRRDSFESRPSTSGYSERRSETSEFLSKQERQSIDQGPFVTHVPSESKRDGNRFDSRPNRGCEGGPRRFEHRNFEGGRQFDNRGRGAEGGRHYDNRGRGGEGGRFFNNRGRGNEGGRYFDNRNRSESRGSSTERGSVSGFGGSSFRGVRGGFDRGRTGDRSNRPNRRMRRRKMTPEEEAACVARMLARDEEAERKIRAAAEMPPPQKPAT